VSLEYRSVTFCTSNEAKLREVVLEYQQIWWQRLFFLPATVETWVGGTIWYNKHTGARASMSKSIEIDGAVQWCKRHSEALNQM
jgi:hypothetical protein